MLRLIQLTGRSGGRVGVVTGDSIELLSTNRTIYGLAMLSLSRGASLKDCAVSQLSGEMVDYNAVYAGHGDWQVGLPIDHPDDPARVLVSGTGLTHMASVKNRDAMHSSAQNVTDSVKMYQLGLAGGRPEAGRVGTSPEWFYKGNGSVLKAHNQPLSIPFFAEDGGEEPEIAGVYVIDNAGNPRRIGFCQGNEFSDHLFEKRNYLYLASSKLRECAIGPELIVDGDFHHVKGEVSVFRKGETLWSQPIQTGEEVMCHSLANMEHHHFKFPGHRRPGDVHVHYYGADAFSFGAGILLQDGDWMQVSFDGFGRPLRNPVQKDEVSEAPVTVTAL